MAMWLLFTAFMVFAMTVIGAITRLTESGLSMVEWRPLIGALPPLSDAEWQRVFDLYRETPEYRAVHHGMTLAEFQQIFFWEWLHRLWGRLIGVVYALPLLVFWLRGAIPQGFHRRLLVLLALGALQGLLGWFMVKSGLIDRPSVSHYRLAAHLAVALVIYGVLVWTALDLRDVVAGRTRPLVARPGVRRLVWVTLGLLAVTIVWGAFTAGLDAGMMYNTWPLMNGAIVPPEAFALDPAVLNAVETRGMVQFIHRWLGAITMLAALAAGWRCLADPRTGGPALAVGAAAIVQVCLGIFTLLEVVPVALAAAHQAGAVVLLTALLVLVRRV
ncbi:MAG: COX15/CtaA family protein [Rhodospirillaceae bacterium]|nr:COX15/CtaA family protein [Rhodospirillaceae bacterium]